MSCNEGNPAENIQIMPEIQCHQKIFYYKRFIGS